MQGTADPDYGTCVDIVTKGALRAMVVPGLLRRVPAGRGPRVQVHLSATDSSSRAEAVAALLMVGTIAGILMALFMNNGGGAWDNAKKYIETRRVRRQGQRPPTRPAVVGDTVGDPFKDTAGPSLHVLIKLLSTITLVLAPLFIS